MYLVSYVFVPTFIKLYSYIVLCCIGRSRDRESERQRERDRVYEGEAIGTVRKRSVQGFKLNLIVWSLNPKP